MATHAPYAQAALRAGQAAPPQGARRACRRSAGFDIAGVLAGLRRADGHGGDLQHRADLPETAGQERRLGDVLDERTGRRDVFGSDLCRQRVGTTFMDASKPGYQSVVGQVANTVWPPALHWMFYVVQVSTAIVLLLAANTAFAGFPQLASMMARDNFLPRQLANVGDRLAFNNGIILLALVACALIIIFHGSSTPCCPCTPSASSSASRWLRPAWSSAGGACGQRLADQPDLQRARRGRDGAGRPDHRRL